MWVLKIKKIVQEVLKNPKIRYDFFVCVFLKNL